MFCRRCNHGLGEHEQGQKIKFDKRRCLGTTKKGNKCACPSFVGPVPNDKLIKGKSQSEYDTLVSPIDESREA